MTLSSPLLHAQLSPGKLAQAHAAYEGLSQCATCHTVGSDAFASKCLDCHQALADRIKRKQGLHSDPAYARCQSCHSDHHGRTYALIRWPKTMAAFDHATTGYRLEGRHRGLDCKLCHQAKNQKPPLEKERGLDPAKSFLGLTQACLGCHEDIHRGQLGVSCQSCHGMAAWKPATGFDHSRSPFPLIGAHTSLACKACHPQELAAGLRFKPIAHDRCGDCHADVHQGRLGTDCAACHSLDRFSPAPRFNHARTQFPLKGRHQTLDCATCHPKWNDRTALLFTHQAKGPLQQCQSCHRDPHENRLGQNCGACHDPERWQRVDNAHFDHSRTRFPLLDKHAGVACGKCHGAGFKTKGFEDCGTCHKDVHAGQFKTTVGACASCHDTRAFAPSLFTLQKHQNARFPLSGAHLATPCFACHRSAGPGKAVAYHFPATDCESCHKDVHAGQAKPFMQGKGDCGACHLTDSWRELTFDHGRTKFPLTGSHQQAACGKCHQPNSNDVTALSGLATNCSSCHDDVHRGQFADEKGATLCASCHTPDRWATLHFDHSRTRFALDGAHRDLACNACHQPIGGMGQQATRYKNLDRACASCHATTPSPQ